MQVRRATKGSSTCRYAGLIKCHFETFGPVESVAFDSDDPAAWYVLGALSGRAGSLVQTG